MAFHDIEEVDNWTDDQQEAEKRNLEKRSSRAKLWHALKSRKLARAIVVGSCQVLVSDL